ncbi:hypothetical protein GGR58DRAFT_482823 [Xylaria digitata]|nr:hypothetical protein GGR58DRAFT_482823 [Xylaria digitata]
MKYNLFTRRSLVHLLAEKVCVSLYSSDATGLNRPGLRALPFLRSPRGEDEAGAVGDLNGTGLIPVAFRPPPPLSSTHRKAISIRPVALTRPRQFILLVQTDTPFLWGRTIPSPPSTPISQRCSSSQADDYFVGLSSGVGLEDHFAGLEWYPDPGATSNAFDAFDYSAEDWSWIGADGFQPREEVPKGLQDESITSPKAAELASLGVGDPDWLGVPMVGQFPFSNWLFGRLDTRRQDTACVQQSNRIILESYLSEEQDLSPAQDIVAGNHSRQITLDGTQHAATANTIHCVHRHSADKRKHSCTECAGHFSGPRDLRRHIETVHRKQMVQCPRYTRTFKNRPDNLKRYMAKYCKANSPKSG